MKKLLTLLFLLCSASILSAQETETLPHYSYLYKLNEEQVVNYREGKFEAKLIIRNERPADSLALHQNSYLYLLKKRSFGYFLEVRYGSFGPEMVMLLVSPVQVSAYRFQDRWQVYLYDSSGFITDFNIKTTKRGYETSEHCGCVEIEAKRLPKGSLRLHYGKQFLVLNQYDFTAPETQGGMMTKPRFRFFQKKYTPFEPGFLVLNQSEYRHLDSLHAKAYLMDRKGRPHTGDVQVQIHAPNSHTYYFQTFPARKLTEGAYSFDWQIPDSLQMDQVYEIRFIAQSNASIYKTSSFKVTHYAFKNYKISVHQSGYHLLPGDSAFIRISATDQNNIPLAGSKAEIRFRLSQTGKLHIPSLSIPDSFSRNFLDTTIYLEPENETWFRVPQSLLASIDHGLYAEVKVTTPDNDIHNQTLSFQGTQTLDEYTSGLRNDTLLFGLLRNKRPISSDTVIVRVSDRFFSETQEYRTTLPLRIPNADRYASVYILDTLYNIKSSYVPSQYGIFFNGTKTRDSLYLWFNNASLYHLNWELYRKGKRFLTGNSDSLAIPLGGTEPVQVVYRYLSGAQMFYMQQVVVPATQALTIQHNLPAVAYPGQTIIADITVYDFHGKPVKNANLTGVSINTQMPVINPPVIPYYPKIKGVTIPMRALSFSFPYYNAMSFTAQDTANYRNFDLHRYLHYRLYYSPNALHEERIASPDTSTSIQVVYYEGGSYHYPREIWVDGEIRYLITGNDRQRNVLKMEPGTHRIAIRTPTYFIQIDSFVCEKGKANLLGINTLRMGENSRLTFETIAQGYEEQELEKVEEHVLFLNNGTGKPCWIEQEDRIYEAPNSTNYMYGNYSGYYAAIAPLKEGMVTWFTKDTSITFYFNPEQVYVVSGNTIHPYAKPTFIMSNAMYAHTAGYYLNSPPLSLRELQRRWFVEDSLAEVEKRKKPIVRRHVPQVTQFQEYHGFSETATYASLEIQDGDKALVQRNFIWLENLNEPRYSLYTHSNLYQLTALRPGVYRLVTGSYLGEMIEVDSLVIDSLHRHFIRLDKMAKPLEPAHWAEMQYHYFLTLNKYGSGKVPLYDAYTIQQEASAVSSKGEVSGTALINLQPGAHSYVLFIHQNGQNRYLAVANNQGHFRMYDMVAGTYWVQIISTSRQVFFARQINLREGSLLNLQLDCLTDTSLRKHITPHTLIREFSPEHALYTPIEGKFSNFEGRVFDKETKLPLASAQVRVVLNGVIVGGAVTDEEGNYHICCLKPGKYQVEVMLGAFEGCIVKNVILKPGQALRYNHHLRQSEAVNALIAEGKYLFAFGDQNNISYASPEDMGVTSLGSVSYSNVGVYEIQTTGGRGLNFNFDFGDGLERKKKEKDAGIEAIEESIDEKARLDEISMDPSANRIRKNFQTNAFWVPNLITGKDGKTAFTYTLPDDQTQWINFLVAINRKQQTSLNTTYTRSYKPLSASLRVPDFVVIGDRITIGGTVRNLIGDSIQIVIRETLDSIEKANTQTVGGYLRQERVIEVKAGKDSLTLGYSLQYNNYIDGEERKVKVLSDKVYDRKVQTRILGTGETVQIDFNPEATRRSIRIQSGLRDLLEEEIMNLKRYQYGCVEQTASKLYAMLRERQLRKTLGEVFTEKQEIVFLIKRLEEFQNSDGSWGWWKGSVSNPALTIYVSRALMLAEQEGFSSRGQKRGAGNLFNQYSLLSDAMKLQTLLLGKELGMKYDYAEQAKWLEKRNLSKEAKISLVELKMVLGLPYDLEPIYASLQTDGFGNTYVNGESSWGFNAHVITLTMQAYRVLRMAGGQETTLLSMRKFLFNKLGYARKNTFERAAIINTLTDEIKEQKLGLIEVRVGNQTIYTSGVYVITGDSVVVVNKGAGVSVIAVEEYESQANTKQAMGIRLNTSFPDRNANSFHLETGDITRLRVEATVSEYQKYLVLNVPIPAGCRIVSKPEAGGVETAREYFSDHVVIYFEHLSKGTYTFDLYLLPQFEGDLTLMPALMENMYAPEFFGREMKRKVEVTD